MEMMSCKDSGPGYYYSDDLGAAAAADNFLDMFGHHSSGDLFELVRKGAGGTTMEAQPAVSSSFPMSPPVTPPARPHMPPDMQPSEDEMAAWLYPIVRGEEFVAGQPSGNGDVAGNMSVDDQQAPVKESKERWTEKREKLPTTEGKCAKRRRSKINERLKTLQKLVPGCDKSNQALTLDQTIQYVKSLQQYIQAMCVGFSTKRVAAAAVYPVVQPPPPYVAPRLPMQPAAGVAPGMVAVGGHLGRPGVFVGLPPMVPFGPMLRCPHHPAAVMMPAPLIYPPAAPNVAPAAGSISGLM